MATTIDRDGDDYLLCFSVPESAWIADLAKSMGITREAVVGAAINNGLTHYVGSFLTPDEPPDKLIDVEDETNKPTSDAKDHKTYDKGSCQG